MSAGYEVVAVDAFADTQTQALCRQVVMVPYDAQGFDAIALLAALEKIDLSQFVGCVYGSGFEAQPALLSALAKLLPLLGNDAEVVARVKHPLSFFATLKQQQIAHPDWYLMPPTTLSHVLVKNIGGSGGGHIRYADVAVDAQNLPCYFQEKTEGEAVSLLFIAYDQRIQILGFNLQWTDPTDQEPFRYGGAAGNADLSAFVKFQLQYAAEKSAQRFGLLGLNSLDAIVKADVDGEQVIVLEVNPRLSATLDSYVAEKPDVFEQHMQACLGQAVKSLPICTGVSMAHAVVYADTDFTISRDFVWPSWVKDNPAFTTPIIHIKCGAPLCTVQAVAEHALASKRLAQARAKAILQTLKQHHKSY